MKEARTYSGEKTASSTSGSLVAPTMQEPQVFSPWVRKISWRRKWQPTPVFLPGKSHGQRSLAGYSPRVTESDMTEHTRDLAYDLKVKNFLVTQVNNFIT